MRQPRISSMIRADEQDAFRRGGANAASVKASVNRSEVEMLKEFREFALKGNVVDLAIGVIIGAAFGKIVDSMVGDMIMPLIGALGNVDFSNYFIGLNQGVTATVLEEAKKQGAVLAWGKFVTVVINFIIIAWVLFLVVKAMNKMKKAEAAAPPAPAAPPEDVKLLTEIRDLLSRR
jgi:large conductance mechanosensitive channel